MNVSGWIFLGSCAAIVACGETEAGPRELDDPSATPLPLAGRGGAGASPLPSAGSDGGRAGGPASGGAISGEKPVAIGGATAGRDPATSGGVNPAMDDDDDDAGAAGDGGVAPVGGAPGIDCDPITFEDSELELAVREAVGKLAGPLTSADVAGLSQLVTPAITSLGGIECLLDLTSLDAGSQPPSQITDLTPLRGLTKLVEVDLDRNPLASLAPLGELPNLERLYLIKLPVTLDLSPLAGAPKLVELYLQSDTVVSFGPLGAVSTLKNLSIDNATVQHPESIAAVTSLDSLLANSVFEDAAPLASLTKLQKLRIAQKPLSHFDTLSVLTELRLLDIANTGVSDITPVARMPQLSAFFAGFNAISDIAPLATLDQLNLVALNVNQIDDLTPLSQNLGIGATDFLYLGGNPFSCPDNAPNLSAMRLRGAVVDTDCE